MFGHLKPEEFVNLIEGDELTRDEARHLESCVRCRSTWESMQSLRDEMASMDEDIPEPEWADFRSSVRDALLSRSIQRETAVRRWTGWAVRPGLAWALSLLMAVGITTVTVIWKMDHRSAAPVVSHSEPAVPVDPPLEVLEAGPEISLFGDVVALGEEQQEQLRQMLESAQAQNGATHRK